MRTRTSRDGRSRAFGVITTLTRVAASAALALSLAACGGGGSSAGGGASSPGGGTPPPPVTLVSISVYPSPAPALPKGLTQQFTAWGFYSNGSSNALSTVTWSTSAATVATISASGLATGVALGTTNINASAGGVISTSVALTVTPAALQSIALSPLNPTMGAGQTTQFTATGTYSDATTPDITALVGWGSSNTAVATLNAPGAASGVAPGTATISASLSAISSSTTLTVANYSVGGTQSLLPAGASTTLLNNGTDSLTLTNATASPTSHVPFYFNTALPLGSAYNVTVSTQPTGAGVHPCTVVDGIGSIVTTFVTSVQIVCGPALGTLAGTPAITGSFANGTAAAAAFYGPRGMAVDAAGNVYVADLSNEVIRKITPGAVVTTLAGTVGTIGYVNATGTSAVFWQPYAVAVDASGNVYVADSGNNAIRKITSAGVVTTFAGSATGAWGFTNGTGTGATFNWPLAVAVDTSGNVYVADTSNNAIRKITPLGVVSTLATGFSGPQGVAVDTVGNVYVSDTGTNVIRKVTPAGVVSLYAGVVILSQTGGYLDGSAATAKFNMPMEVAVDTAGNVYVADWGNTVIRLITPAGMVSTIAGTPGNGVGSVDGPALSGTLGVPYGVAVDSTGHLYISDNITSIIRKYTP